MFDEIYQVEKSDYVGFLDQINPDAIYTSKEVEDEHHMKVSVISKNTGNILCGMTTTDLEDEEIKYYVINMPQVIERVSPRVKRVINIETKEELQEFFNIISKIMKEKKND